MIEDNRSKDNKMNEYRKRIIRLLMSIRIRREDGDLDRLENIFIYISE